MNKSSDLSEKLSPIQIDLSDGLSSDEEGRTRGSASSGAKSSTDVQGKSRPKADIVFTDKGRAATVVTAGELDIAVVDRRERSKLVKEGEEGPPPPRDAVLFHCEAKKFLRCGNFEAALRSVIQAQKMLTTDRKEWLLTKARCHFRLFQMNESLQDIQNILEKDPLYLPAIFLKAQVLYSVGELEQSLLCYIRGSKLKPRDPECARGILGVERAIQEKLTCNGLLRSTKKRNVNYRPKVKSKRSVRRLEPKCKKTKTRKLRTKHEKKDAKFKNSSVQRDLRSFHDSCSHLMSDWAFLASIETKKVLFGCTGNLDLKERARSVLQLIREAREFVFKRQQFCCERKQQPQ